MKIVLILLLFPIAATCQVARFTQTNDTLCFQGRDAISIWIENINGDTVTIDSVVLSDTFHFAYQGILSPMALSEKRRLDVFAKGRFWENADCVVSIFTNSIDLQGRAKTFHVFGMASVLEVREWKAVGARNALWYDVLGRLCDSTKAGFVVSSLGVKKLNVR